jgi:hypothetical protein
MYSSGPPAQPRREAARLDLRMGKHAMHTSHRRNACEGVHIDPWHGTALGQAVPMMSAYAPTRQTSEPLLGSASPGKSPQTKRVRSHTSGRLGRLWQGRAHQVDRAQRCAGAHACAFARLRACVGAAREGRSSWYLHASCPPSALGVLATPIWIIIRNVQSERLRSTTVKNLNVRDVSRTAGRALEAAELTFER